MSTFLPSNTRCELCSCIFTHVTVYNPRWCIRSVVPVSGLFFLAPLQPAPGRARIFFLLSAGAGPKLFSKPPAGRPLSSIKPQAQRLQDLGPTIHTAAWY